MKRPTPTQRRRAFLGTAAGTGVLVAAASIPGAHAAAANAAATEAKPAAPAPRGYRETERIRRYYDLARY